MERSQRIIASHLVIIRCTFPKYEHWEWTPAHMFTHKQEQRKQSITNIINIICILNTLSSFWRVLILVLLIAHSKPSKKQILWSPFYREGKWKPEVNTFTLLCKIWYQGICILHIPTIGQKWFLSELFRGSGWRTGENRILSTISKRKLQGSHNSCKGGRNNLLVQLLSVPPRCCLVLNST